jgi:hypothetical protein
MKFTFIKQGKILDHFKIIAGEKEFLWYSSAKTIR